MKRKAIVLTVLATAASLAAAVAATGSTAAKGVDTCRLFTKGEATAVLGKGLLPADKQGPGGTLLGSCTYVSTTGKGAQVSAMASSEWGNATSANPGKKVSGIGAKASWNANVGLFVQPKGRPYMLQVLAFHTPGKPDKALTLAVARRSLT